MGHKIKALPIEEVVLQRLNFAIRSYVDKSMLDRTDIETYIDDVSGHLVARLEAFVYGENLKNWEFEEWVTVWDHLRYVLFRKIPWLYRRFPANKKVITLTATALYPELSKKFSLPDDKPYINIHKMEKSIKLWQ